MLHVPDRSQSNAPLTILFHGFTGNRIEANRLLFHLANALEERGVAALRFDFIGCGESDGSYADLTLTSLLEQAETVFEWVLSSIEPKEICVVGYSLGGFIGSLMLERTPSIHRAVLISPGQPRRILERDQALYEHASDVIDLGGTPVGRAYYLGLQEYLDRPAAFHDGQEILIVHGTHDQATPIECSQYYLSIPGGNKRLVAVKGADHRYSSIVWQQTLLEHATRFLTQE